MFKGADDLLKHFNLRGEGMAPDLSFRCFAPRFLHKAGSPW